MSIFSKIFNPIIDETRSEVIPHRDWKVVVVTATTNHYTIDDIRDILSEKYGLPTYFRFSLEEGVENTNYTIVTGADYVTAFPIDAYTIVIYNKSESPFNGYDSYGGLYSGSGKIQIMYTTIGMGSINTDERASVAYCIFHEMGHALGINPDPYTRFHTELAAVTALQTYLIDSVGTEQALEAADRLSTEWSGLPYYRQYCALMYIHMLMEEEYTQWFKYCGSYYDGYWISGDGGLPYSKRRRFLAYEDMGSGSGYDADLLDGNDSTAFLKHSLATAASQFLVSSGVGSFVVKTVAEIKTLLGLGGAALLDVGTTSGTVAAGDDSRLSDARTPTSHDNTYHSSAYVTASGVTYENLNTNGDIGSGVGQVADGSHTHTMTALGGMTWGGYLSADPVSPVDGTAYWNTTSSTLKIYPNSTVGWKTITTT